MTITIFINKKGFQRKQKSPIMYQGLYTIVEPLTNFDTIVRGLFYFVRDHRNFVRGFGFLFAPQHVCSYPWPSFRTLEVDFVPLLKLLFY